MGRSRPSPLSRRKASARSHTEPRAAWLCLAALWLVVPACHDESLAPRRAQVAAMTPTQKEELARRQESFASLPPDEQAHLRQLDQQLGEDEHAAQLRQVMHRYYRWVTQLSQVLPYEPSALLELPPAERLQRVRDLQQELARRKDKASHGSSSIPSDRTRRWLSELGNLGLGPVRRITEEDLKILQPWLAQWLTEHESMILNQLPEPHQQRVRHLLESTPEREERQGIMMTVWLRLQWHRPLPLLLNDGELAELLAQLPPEAQNWLTALKVPEGRRILMIWLRLTALYQVLQHPATQLPLVEEDELIRFLTSETINSADRERLLNLPPEETKRELLLAYLRWRINEERAHQPIRPPGKR